MLELLKLIFGGLVFFVVIVVAVSFIQSDSIIRTTPDGNVVKESQVKIYIDPETKCEYLVVIAGTMLTPRLNKDGNQICR